MTCVGEFTREHDLYEGVRDTRCMRARFMYACVSSSILYPESGFVVTRRVQANGAALSLHRAEGSESSLVNLRATFRDKQCQQFTHVSHSPDPTRSGS